MMVPHTSLPDEACDDPPAVNLETPGSAAVEVTTPSRIVVNVATPPCGTAIDVETSRGDVEDVVENVRHLVDSLCDMDRCRATGIDADDGSRPC